MSPGPLLQETANGHVGEDSSAGRWAESPRSAMCMVNTHYTVDSKQLEHGYRMIHAGFPSFFVLGLEDSRDRTCGPLL